MSRRGWLIAGALAALGSAGQGARADDGSPVEAPSQLAVTSAPDSGAADGEATSTFPGDQEIGARAGVALGGRTTPGGLQLSGRYLYRLAERDWFDGSVGFTFGGGGEACFRDRQDEVLCNHGFASGFAAEISAGVARYFRAEEPFSPFVRGGVSARVVAFPGDEIRGVAAPLWAGAGVRARVHEGVAVVGGAELRAGPAWMTRGVGLEPHASFAITAGVDFELD